MPSEVLIARQAIFDRTRTVYGYELLYRGRTPVTGALLNQFDGTEGEQASKQVLANSLLAFGLEGLLNGKKAFVNFNKAMLLADWNTALPRDRAIIEILETVEPDEDVTMACARLKSKGYRLALDDFVFHPRYGRLLGFVDLIKVEVRAMPRTEQECHIRNFHAKGQEMLAEKVETYEEFEWARMAGYDYFQGYFFARPEILHAKQISSGKLQSLRLLQEAQRPNLDLHRLESLILQDVSFSYKMLRYVNSALFHHNAPVQSISQAVLFLGEDFLRKWIAMAVLSQVGHKKPSELVTQSLVRGLFCEFLCQFSSHPQRDRFAEPAFLMGLFSLLDAILDRPLADALAEVHVAPAVMEALLGDPDASIPAEDFLGTLYRLMRNYEAGNWDAAVVNARRVGLETSAVSQAYCDAVARTDQTLNGYV